MYLSISSSIRTAGPARGGTARTKSTRATQEHRQAKKQALTMIMTILLLFLVALLDTTTTTWAAAASPDADIRWHEIRPSQTQHDLDPDLQDDTFRPPRRLFWEGRYDPEMIWKPSGAKASPKILHPMRTDKWKLHIHWRGKERTWQKRQRPRIVELEFHPNGYCRFCGGDDVLGIGTWQVFPWGVWFTMEDSAKKLYTFTAGLHLNSFGPQPKMIQGNVMREVNPNHDEDDFFLKRQPKPWFRPVVGTFSGEGIGQDMADFSYKSRGLGLSQ